MEGCGGEEQTERERGREGEREREREKEREKRKKKKLWKSYGKIIIRLTFETFTQSLTHSQFQLMRRKDDCHC